MKAILVFDVENIDIENTQATYIELQCNDITIQMALVNHWLKPMPYRYVEDKVRIETTRDAEVCTHGIQIGRNMVINEILGETE